MIYSNPIFIVGCPRSGTTLLQCMLSSNEGTFTLPETHYFCSVLPTLQLRPEDPLTHPSLQKIIRAFRLVLKLNLPEQFYAGLIDRMTKEHLSALSVLHKLIEIHRPKSDLEKSLRLIEKTPRHVFHMNEILQCFPSARFINVVRDPRDVVSSQLMPHPKARSVLRHANSWMACVKKAAQFEAQFPHRILSIRYEDLAANTESVLRDVCEFLDLVFHASMISEFASQHESCILPHEVSKEGIKTGKVVNSHGIWRSRINAGQAWLVEQAVDTMLRACKYIQDSNPTPEERIEALRHEYQVIHQHGSEKDSRDFLLTRLLKISHSIGFKAGLFSQVGGLPLFTKD